MIFRAVCLVSTACMVVYCSYEFLQNKDLSEVSFSRFNNENENSMYPQISLCFMGSFLENELKNLGDGINSTTYAQFLNGELWDDRMRNIDIEKVTTKLEDHLFETCVRSSYDSNCKNKGHISSSIFPYGAFKCLLFQFAYPRTVWEAAVWIKSSIFSTGIRFSHKFAANIGFPNKYLGCPQQLLSGPLETIHQATTPQCLV